MPIKSQLHEDRLLSNLSVQYKNPDYIADKVAPMVKVQNDTDKYRVYSRDFRLPETIRRDGAEARSHDFAVSTASYILEEHALKSLVTDRAARNYDLASLQADVTEDLTDAIMLRKEKTVADLFTSTNFSLNVSLATANQFSLNTTTSNPITYFDTACTTVLANSGYLPNKAVMERSVMLNQKNHTSIAERVKYVSSEITKNTLAALYDIPEILIGVAQIDSAAEGVTDSIGNIWPDNIGVMYVAPSASPRKPSSLYTFQAERMGVRRWRDEKVKGEWIEVGTDFDCKIVASLAAYLIKDTQA
jgi:hypothetical protein